MNFVGIDVSKNKLDCLWLKDVQGLKVKTKVFKNQSGDFEALALWLVKNIHAEPSEITVTLEATGVYHEAVSHSLYDYGFKINLVNPARPKAFAQGLGITHKTDKADSLLLARFGAQTTANYWQPEPKEVRELKALIRRVEAIEKDILREENRKEQVEIANVSQVVRTSLEHVIEVLNVEKKRLEKEIDDHIDDNPELKKDRKLLESIPGIGSVLSRLMLSELNSKSFDNAGSFAAYLGLIPKIRESGTFKGRSTLTKQGPARVRAKIYMAAIVAKQHNPDVKELYERLKSKGKTHMQALGAAMRKLSQICYGVLKHQCEYQPQIA